jgi:hypothetical protein
MAPAKPKKPSRFGLRDLAVMLFGFPRDIGEAELQRRLHSQEEIEKNHTANNIYGNVRRMMEALRTDDPLELFSRRSAGRPGRYAVEDFLDARVMDGVQGEVKAPATKLAYLHALASVSNPYKKSTARFAARVPSAARRRFARLAARYEAAVRKSRGGRLEDERDLRSILPWQDIMAAYKKNRAALPTDQQRLIADIYMGFGDRPAGAPKRLDFGRVAVYRSDTPVSARTEKNHVVVNVATGGVRLRLAEFKTAKVKGVYDEALPRGLARRVVESLGSGSWRKWLLFRAGSDGSLPMSANSLGSALSVVTKRLTGRSIPICGLRKSFVTYAHALHGRAELERFAYHMGHSVATARDHYKKTNIEDSLKVVVEP